MEALESWNSADLPVSGWENFCIASSNRSRSKDIRSSISISISIATHISVAVANFGPRGHWDRILTFGYGEMSAGFAAPFGFGQ